MGVGAGLYMCDVVKKVHVRYLISWWVLVYLWRLHGDSAIPFSETSPFKKRDVQTNTETHTKKRWTFLCPDPRSTKLGMVIDDVTSRQYHYFTPENFSMWIGSIVSLLGGVENFTAVHPRHKKNSFNFATRKGKWPNSKFKCRTV